MKVKMRVPKRILSLVLALVMVLGMMPHFAMEAHAINKKLNNFTVSVTMGECKYCNEEHYAENLNIKSVNIQNGNVTIEFSSRFGSNTDCSRTLNYGKYNNTSDTSLPFTYSLTRPFSCVEDFRVWLMDVNFGDDKPLLSGSITRSKSSHNIHSWSSIGTNQHQGTCSVCGITVTENCTGDANANCTVQGTCTTCNGKYNTDSHSYTYTPNGNVLTETCLNGCGHEATATLEYDTTLPNYVGNDTYTYTGSEIKPLKVTTSSGWQGGELAISYSGNTTNVGDAMGVITATAQTDVKASLTYKITAKTLTSDMVTLSPASGTYTGSTHNAPTYTLTYNGKELDTDDYTAGAWSGDLLNADTYTLELTGKGNFAGSLTLTYTINPAELTNVKVEQSGELTYDGTPKVPEVTAIATTVDDSEPTFTYSTVQAGTYGTMPSFTNAGEYTVYYKASADNHDTTETGSFTVTIAPADASITIPENQSVTYDGEAITAGTSNADILYSYNGDSTPVVKWYADMGGAKGDEISAPANAGTYWIGVSAPEGNYKAVEEVTAPITIAKKEVAAPVIGSKAYTGEAQTAEVPASDLYAVTGNEGGTAVDSYDVVLTLTDPSNYKWTDSEEAAKTLAFQITQAQNSWITEPNVTDWTYGGGANIPTADAKFGTVTVEYRLQSGKDADYTTEVPVGAGKYYVRFTVPGTNDYAALSAVKELEIAKAPLTVTAENKTATYGDAAPTYTVTYDGFAGSENKDVLGGTLAFDCAYAQYADKGTYTITPSGYESGNYDISYVDGTLTVNPKAITVTIADKTSVYGKEIVTLTATDNGIVNNDINVYSLATTATKTSDVGTYDITGTALDGNYAITFVNGTYTITKAQVNSIGTDMTVAYTAGMEVDLRQMFSIDENAGAVDYWITHLTGEGSFTSAPYLYRIDKAGTFTVKITTEETANYNSGVATAVLTVNPGDPGIGTVTAGVVNDTLETSAIVLTRGNTTIPGTLTVDAGQTLVLGENTIRYTFTPKDTTNYKVVTGEVTVTVKDTIAPTGTVTVSTNSWNQFLNDITFGLFFKQTQNVSVTASDNLSGVAKIEYIESKTAMDLDAVKAAQQWTEMKNGSVSVTLEDTKQFIYYIRITDKSGNVAYLSTDGAEYDITAPVIEGVNNGATYYTTQTVTVTDKNIDTITLNGEAATGSITLEGNKEATYTIVATDKAGNETTVTVTMKPIRALAEATNDLTDDNVTSANTLALEALVEKLDDLLADDDVTDGERENLEQHKAIAESLIQTIEDTAAEQKAVTDKAAEFDEDAVKSTDKAELEKLAEDIDALLDTNNLTQDERTALETLLEQVEGMTDTIDKTAADSKTATDAIDALDPETVKSTEKAAVEAALETIENLLDGDHLTENERKALEDAKADAEALLAAIDEAAKAANTENTAKVEDVTADNVTPEDKSDLEDAKADLEKALEDNSGNYTEEEKKAIEDEIARIDEALQIIENVEAVEDTISDLPATVEPDDEETVAKIEDAKKAYDELTEYEKSLVDEDTKKKLDDLTAAAVAYKIVKGDGSKWTKGGTSGLSFTANGPLGKFSTIEIDGKVIDAKYYDAVAGSTVITLKASYLETLSTGKHTITVVYTDGEAEGTFKINAKSVTPATGDDSNIFLWSGLLCVSTLGLVALLTDRKRRKATK